MTSTSSPSCTERCAPMSPGERDAVLASARAMKQAAAAHARPLLSGKNIGLLCESHESADARLFQRAAAELGARVARILPSRSGLLTTTDIQYTARMLGRLYDAVECQGLPAALTQQLRRDAGVPVYDGIACADHPSAELAPLVDGDPDDRRFVVQALLVRTIGAS